MTHQFGSATVSELEFFIRTILTQGEEERWIYRFAADTRKTWLGRATRKGQPDPPSYLPGDRRSGCVPAEPYPPLQPSGLSRPTGACTTSNRLRQQNSGFANYTKIPVLLA